MSSTVESATEVRPFHVEVQEKELEDLRRPSAATGRREHETVGDPSR